MRNRTIAGLALIATTLSAPAGAQRVGMAPHGGIRGATPGGAVPTTPAQTPQQPNWSGNAGQQHWNGGQRGWSHGGRFGGWRGRSGDGARWGGRINGRWAGGWNAPGGWSAYRRPTRGWRLPRYWVAPSFYISDYGLYGLAPPPYGYTWSRYYDDAVLIDGSGRVRDYVGGLDWDQYDDGYGPDDDGGYRGESGYGASYPPPPPAAYAPPPPAYAPPPPGYAPPVPVGNGVTTYSSGGYVANGYYYPPVTTTTVTIAQAPSVTTTTTEYVETVRTRYVARKAWKPKRKWRPRPRVDCLCGS